jgi:glycosyltransferase involved in cell wall biosynthesis
MTLAPFLMYRALKPHLARLIRETGGVDLIDAHYFYPDGVAAALLARDFGLPLVVTGRGTDLIVIPRFALPRRQLLWAISRASAMITVCEDLRQRLIALGAAPERVRVLRNGVDLVMFQPQDRVAARAELGLDGPVLICVGGLIPRKGQEFAIGALPALPEATLLIVGEGPDRAKLGALAQSLGVAQRVRFLGRIAHDALPALYSAADIMLLPSSAEGWANVLLESMACGTPVVATRVGGSDEVVTDPAAGVLMRERSVAALAEGVRQILAAPPDRAATRLYAEKFDWQSTTDGQLALFSEVLAAHKGGVTPAARTAPGTAAS